MLGLRSAFIDQNSHKISYLRCPHSIRSMVCVTVGCPSVRPSIRLSVPSYRIIPFLTTIYEENSVYLNFIVTTVHQGKVLPDSSAGIRRQRDDPWSRRDAADFSDCCQADVCSGHRLLPSIESLVCTPSPNMNTEQFHPVTQTFIHKSEK